MADPPEGADFSPPVTAGSSRLGPIHIDVKIRSEGLRLDRYLVQNFPDFSRSTIQDSIDAGKVTVNEKPTKASYKVRHGDQLHIHLPEPTHDAPVPEDIPLDVLYEDEWLALVNKPANMVVHPAKGNWSGTLVNALQFRFRELSNANGTYRAGIVHRLDRDTSGVILIAKEEHTHRDLASAFEQRRVFKEYAALTSGELDRDSDYIEMRIKHHPHDRVKMLATADADDADAKDACSYYEVVERFRGHTFVKVQPRTGRTHQIRIHLASVGCPVLADKTYGGRDRVMLSDLNGKMPGGDDDLAVISRQALHAFRLRFQHPRTGKWIETEAPLPQDMLALLSALRTHRKK